VSLCPQSFEFFSIALPRRETSPISALRSRDNWDQTLCGELARPARFTCPLKNPRRAVRLWNEPVPESNSKAAKVSNPLSCNPRFFDHLFAAFKLAQHVLSFIFISEIVRTDLCC